jgi:hypothetical protein
MRPRYETTEHLNGEYAVKGHLEKVWNTLLTKKTVIGYSPDYDMHRDNKAIGIVEIKCRTDFTYGRKPIHETYNITKKKYDAGALESQQKNIPFYIVVQFSDALYYYRYAPEHKDQITVCMWGRTAARDEFDVEECVAIPINLLNTLTNAYLDGI